MKGEPGQYVVWDIGGFERTPPGTLAVVLGTMTNLLDWTLVRRIDGAIGPEIGWRDRCFRFATPDEEAVGRLSSG